MKIFKTLRKLRHDERAITGLVIGLVVTLVACGVLIPVGLLINAQIAAALPALTGVANTTATQVINNIYSAYSISAIVPIVAVAAVIIGIIVTAFAMRRGGQ